MRILLVEDDHLLGDAIRDHVAAAGHGVDWVKRLDDARAALRGVTYELLLLDLNLPDGRGLDLLKELRTEKSNLPVLILTAQDQLTQRIDGLNAGADDYLVKPFDLNELSARLAAVVRRYDHKPSPMQVFGELEIDLGQRVLQRQGKTLALTSREWAVLERLARSPNITVGKSQLEESLYAFGSEVESNAVEVYVSRLRKKLGATAILTDRGLGYRMPA